MSKFISVIKRKSSRNQDMRVSELIKKDIVIGAAYLFSLSDFTYNLNFSDDGIQTLILYAIFIAKLGAFLIAGKIVDGGSRDIVLATSFMCFLATIALFHFGFGFISVIAYNVLVFISVPWFYYYHHKDDQMFRDTK